MHTLLVAEDNDTDVLILQLAFSMANIACELDIARDGIDALERLRNAPLPFALLLDLRMPRCDGFETLVAVRADPQLAHLPVVVCSSSSDAVDRDRTLAAGATEFITKPSDMEVYQSELQRIVEQYATAS